jgi:hypothetical protein
MQHVRSLVEHEQAFCEQESVVINSKNINEVTEEQVNKLFEDP